MKKEDEHALLILAGLWAISKYAWSIVPAMERAGIKAYEWVHNDENHKQTLPINPLTKQAVLQIATHAGFPNPKLATAIAFAESGGVPNAVADTSREESIGLWQINIRRHHGYLREDMKDPTKNARAAFAISKGGTDWKPWSTYVNGKYKLHLNGVLA